MENVSIVIVDKNFNVQNLQGLVIRSEKYANKIKIQFPKTYEGEDLTGKIFILKCTNANGVYFETLLPKTITAEYIELLWTVTAEFTTVSGVLKIAIFAESANYSLGTTMSKVIVEESPQYSIPIDDFTVLESYMVEIRVAADKVERDRAEALESKNVAVSARDEAATAKDLAVPASVTAVDAKDIAVDAKNIAVDAKDIAVPASVAAVEAKDIAESAKSTAVSARDEAVSASVTAVTAKDEAETAKTAAEAARDIAALSQAGALASKNAAAASQSAAETARTGAESARDIAVTAADDAVAIAVQVETNTLAIGQNTSDLAAHKEEYTQLNIGNRLTNLEEAKIKKYGVRRVLGATTPVLERLGDAVGKVANADTDLTKHNVVQNDFDKIYPWSHMRKCIVDSTGRITYEGEAGYSTAIGDWMIEIPEFYWKRTNDGVILEEWVSPYPVGGYIKSNKFYIARFKTSEQDNAHVSKPNSFPKVALGRAGFRTKAMEKGAGWQLEDLLGNYILNLLYRVEFAHLNSQLILGNGVTSTRYTEDDISQLAETSVNRVVLLNANANNYNIGETISLGTSRGNFAGFQYRVITAINIVDATTKEIVFDGDPINTLTTYKVYQIGQKSGKTLHLLSSSGTAIGANNRSSITYRGIEDVFGNVWEWIDGALINDHRGYVCLDPSKYADTLTVDFKPLSYENAKSNNYAGELGFDSNYPFAEFTVDVTGGSATKYCDYYYQNTGLRAPFVGGPFDSSVFAGFRSWFLNNSPSLAAVSIGSRLQRKA